jgi:hypothetical protein
MDPFVASDAKVIPQRMGQPGGQIADLGVRGPSWTVGRPSDHL